MKSANAGNLVLRIADAVGVNRLLCLKYSVHAFGGNYGLPFVAKNERGILSVKNQHVDLFTECTLAIDDVRSRGLVARGQIGLQEFKPDSFACVTFCARMTEGLSHGLEALLDVIVQA